MAVREPEVIEAELAAFRARRVKVLLAPTEGSEGATSYNNTGMVKELDKAIEKLERELEAANNGGIGIPKKRCC